MAPKYKFQDGERILCFHGPLLYEAKCVRAEGKDKAVKYLIHYNGWNKSWDEWVPESRVLKFNDASIQKQKELEKAHAKNKRLRRKEKAEKVDKSSVNTSPAESTSSAKETIRDTKDTTTKRKVSVDQPAPEPVKKKRTRTDQTVESEEQFLSKIEVKITIPDELKPWLVDDWDLITRQKQLVDVPCKQTVDDILDDYVKAKLAKGNNPQRDAILEVTKGVREYFNVMLGTQILYKFERPQYGEVLSSRPDTPMSQLYGAIHLLRLFVKPLPETLPYTSLDEKSISLLQTYLQDILKYMNRNSQSLFSLSNYNVAPPDYHRKAI